MAREEYFREKFAQAAGVLGRAPADSPFSIKFRNAFFCECATCGWRPALAEIRADAARLRERGLPVEVEPHESGIEIIAFGTISALLATGVIGLSKLVLTHWNRSRDPQSYRDIEIEMRSFRTRGRFSEGRIARVRYPAQQADIEKALEILAAFLNSDDQGEADGVSPDE